MAYATALYEGENRGMKKLDESTATWFTRNARRIIMTTTLKQSKRRYDAQRALARRRDIAAKFGVRSKIVDMICGASPVPVSGTARELTVTVPKRFSFIDDPLAAMGFVRKLARDAREIPHIEMLRIDQFNMSEYDLAANALLDIVVVELETEYRVAQRVLATEGIFPKDEAVANFVRAIGITKHLKVKNTDPAPKIRKKLKVFDKRIKLYERDNSPKLTTARERVAEEFVEHINECLLSSERQLSETGESELLKCLTELINNAEEHAGMIDWSVLGYLDTSEVVPICHVTVMNFGKSMAHTFQELDRGSDAWKLIAPYIEIHGKRNYFSAAWREEDLLTVMALQPNISSKASTADPTRGVGTVELLHFFQAMHSECSGTPESAKMAIVSGGTCICFDGTYRLADHQGRTAIAFNSANDLLEKPDSRYIISLDDVGFPGTLISIKFPLLRTVEMEVSSDGNG